MGIVGPPTESKAVKKSITGLSSEDNGEQPKTPVVITFVFSFNIFSTAIIIKNKTNSTVLFLIKNMKKCQPIWLKSFFQMTSLPAILIIIFVQSRIVKIADTFFWFFSPCIDENRVSSAFISPSLKIGR